MEGTITRIISNLCTVNVNGKLYDCKPRGKFHYEKITPLVGDKVIIDPVNNYLLEIKPRKNYLNRPSIANIDACLIIASVKKPDLNLNLLDKLLCVIIYNQRKRIILFTKGDLLNEDEKKEIRTLIKYYNEIGISSLASDDLLNLDSLIANKIIVLTGETGAGKSTLLNKLIPNLELKTDEISYALNRGKHTTRHVELYKYHDAYLADTPGFGSIDLTDIPIKELKKCFFEFNVPCKYQDCEHLKEAGCLVKELTNEGKILQSRYDHYLKFRGELSCK